MNQRPRGIHRWWARLGVAATVTMVVAAALTGASYAEDEEPVVDPVGGMCSATGLETIATDRPEYQPGDTVLMDGSGYAGDCDVVVRVTRPDGTIVVGDGSFAPGSDTVSIPTDGSLAYQYKLNGVTGIYLVDVLGADEAILASTTFEDPAVQLHTDAAFGTQNYIFRRGDTVHARFDTALNLVGGVTPQYASFEVLNPSGAIVQSNACLLTTSFAGSKPADSFSIDPSDPLSSSSSWTYRMKRHGTDATCTTVASTFNTPFAVAQAFAFADMTARDACVSEAVCVGVKTTFGPGQTAWVKVLGVGFTTLSTTPTFDPSRDDIDVQWIKPNSTTSPASNLCRLLADANRPDSDVDGGLKTGYRPVDVGQTPVASPPSVASCGAFAAGEQGQWMVRLGLGTNHAVTLSPFSVDLDVPTVTIIKSPPTPLTPSDTEAEITWDADEAGTYSVRVGGTSCTTGTAVESGDYLTANADVVTAIAIGDLAYGANTVRVCLTDGAGNTGSDTATVYRQVPTSLLYNGTQIVNAGTSLPLGAKLTSSNAACAVSGNKVAFTLDRNPITGAAGPYTLAASITTNGSGQASTSVSTTNWEEGVYELTATFTGSNTCAASSDTATLTVARPGQASNGGGFYTLSGNGRVNFGFTVRKVQGTTDTYKGQIVLINNGKWRLKGTLTSFSKTGSPPNGASNGIGDLYVWSTTLNDWVLSEAGVTFTISTTDNGSGKKSYDKFGIHINHVLASGEPSLPNSAKTDLKGGNITIF